MLLFPFSNIIGGDIVTPPPPPPPVQTLQRIASFPTGWTAERGYGSFDFGEPDPSAVAVITISWTRGYYVTRQFYELTLAGVQMATAAVSGSGNQNYGSSVVLYLPVPDGGIKEVRGKWSGTGGSNQSAQMDIYKLTGYQQSPAEQVGGIGSSGFAHSSGIINVPANAAVIGCAHVHRSNGGDLAVTGSQYGANSVVYDSGVGGEHASFYNKFPAAGAYSEQWSSPGMSVHLNHATAAWVPL